MDIINNKICSDFEKYIGCPITVTQITGSYGYVNTPKNDPFYKQIECLAILKKYTIRLWFPRSVGTRDIKKDRLNIVLDKINNNLYTIKRIYLG